VRINQLLAASILCGQRNEQASDRRLKPHFVHHKGQQRKKERTRPIFNAALVSGGLCLWARAADLLATLNEEGE